MFLSKLKQTKGDTIGNVYRVLCISSNLTVVWNCLILTCYFFLRQILLAQGPAKQRGRLRI